jgi:hypothetical protein
MDNLGRVIRNELLSRRIENHQVSIYFDKRRTRFRDLIPFLRLSICLLQCAWGVPGNTPYRNHPLSYIFGIKPIGHRDCFQAYMYVADARLRLNTLLYEWVLRSRGTAPLNHLHDSTLEA